jgi:ribosomal protein S17
MNNDGTAFGRGLIAIDKYCANAQVGDIVLFRCTFPLSIVQRSLTGT